MPKANAISKKQVIAPAITAAIVLMMAPAMLSTPGAFAIAPEDTTRSGGLHFVGDPNLTVNKDDDSASLSVSGEVAGAGNGGTARLEATAVITVGCITPSGSNEPRGLQEFDEDVVGEATFDTTRQGRGTFDFTTDSVGLPSDFDCPSANMEETLVSVTFTDITLTVIAQTGTITATFADQDP
jgi:hypothetical protein